MTEQQADIQFMQQAIRLARRGIGHVSPNPAVGAVIVRDGVVIGKGYHHCAGMPHAEVEAIRSLNDPALARGATIYVTLEPCCTFGRTPPCCDAIIQHGFARVVVGCPDPNPAHAGRGFCVLRDAGITVTEDVCRPACEKLNEVFFHWIRTRTPFVVLKMAETLDGRIATAGGSSQWITGPEARKHVMALRMQADAVMVGSGTYRIDQPSLTVRRADGKVLKTPRRFVASHRALELPEGWECADVSDKEKWNAFLARIGGEQVTMLLLEGGGELAASALHAGVVNKMEMHIAPKILGGRGSRPVVGGADPDRIADGWRLRSAELRKAGEDWIISGYPERN